MPKNKGAGGKNRRKGKGAPSAPRELVTKEEGEEYAQVTNRLGNGFMEVLCFTSSGNVIKRAHIRGKMRKKIWMNKDDIVLVSTRGFQDSTCDILMKYTPDQARILKSRKLIPNDININVNSTAEDEANVVFDDEEDDGEDDEDEFKQKTKVAKQTRNVDLPPSDSDEETDPKDLDIDDL